MHSKFNTKETLGGCSLDNNSQDYKDNRYFDIHNRDHEHSLSYGLYELQHEGSGVLRVMRELPNFNYDQGKEIKTENVKLKFWARHVLNEQGNCKGDKDDVLTKEAILEKVQEFSDMIHPILGKSILEDYSHRVKSDGVFFILCLLGSFIGGICVYYTRVKKDSDWTVLAFLPTLIMTLVFSYVIGSKLGTV